MKTETMQYVEKRAKTAAVLGMLVVLIVGLLVGSDYGPGCDQDTETRILFMNLRAYARLVLDEDSSYVQSLGTDDVATDIERDHGAAALYPAALFSASPTVRSDTRLWLRAYRWCVFLFFWCGLCALYRLGKKLTGSRLAGMAGVLLLWLTPRFFAESTYNNKDMASLSAVMMALSAGWDFVCGDAGDWRSPALFGVACAFAVNMRVSGLIVLGVVGLLYLGTLTVNRRWSMASFLRGMEAVLSGLLAFIALTPATWGGHFLDYWQYVFHNATAFSRWVDYTMAAGQLFHTELRPIAPWYIPAYIAVTLPVILLTLFLAGSVWTVAQLVGAARRGWQGWTMQQSYRVLLLLIILLSWASVAFGSNLYNGWRHLYSLLAPITLLAICMLHRLLTCGRQPLQWGAAAAVCGQLVFCAFVIITRHPMEFAWYNVLAGPRADQSWDGDWWGIASKLVLEKTYAENGPCSVGCEQGFYLNIGLEQCNDAVKENIAITDYREADYIAVDMQFARHAILAEQWQIPGETPDDTVAKMVQTQTPEFELKCGDFVLWGVYKNEHKPSNSN